MKFLSTETYINEIGNREIKIALDHHEIDSICSGLTGILNRTSWNLDDPAKKTLFDFINTLYANLWKCWEATSPRDPIPIDPAQRTPIEETVEFVPNQPPEDVAAIETEFSNPPDQGETVN